MITQEKDKKKDEVQGQITSLSVLRTYRRLGVASKLMTHAINMMQEYFDADYVSLHVRVTNRPALHLYHKTLGFDVKGIEKECQKLDINNKILYHNIFYYFNYPFIFSKTPDR